MTAVDILLLPESADDHIIDDSNNEDSTSLLSPIGHSSVAAHVNKLVDAEQSVSEAQPSVKYRRGLLPAPIARILARFIDLSWEGALAGFTIYTAFENTMGAPNSTALYFMFFLITLPITLLLDTFVQAVFGNTPGKLLLGLKAVTWRGSKLTLRTAFNRNFLFWRSALGCGIVPLIPFALLSQFRLLGKGSRTSYDAHQHLRVKYEPYPVLIQGIVLLGLLALLIVPILDMTKQFNPLKSVIEFDVSRIKINKTPDGLSSITYVEPLNPPTAATLQNETKTVESEPILTSTQTPGVDQVPLSETSIESPLTKQDLSIRTSWTNPYTDLSTDISSVWLSNGVHQTGSDYLFQNADNRQQIRLSRSTNLGGSLSEAADGFRAQHSGDISFIGTGTEITEEGKQVWEIEGVPTSGEVKDILVQLYLDNQYLYVLQLEGQTADSSLLSEARQMLTTIWRTIE